jgi:hypothetical protein
VVAEFKARKLDYAMDAATLLDLCPGDVDERLAERTVAALSFTPRLMLMNSMSFLLLLTTLADAEDEVRVGPWTRDTRDALPAVRSHPQVLPPLSLLPSRDSTPSSGSSSTPSTSTGAGA